MQSAVESLCGRFLDFSTIPLGLTSLCRAGDPAAGQALAELEIAALSSLQFSSGEIGSGVVGVELTTEFLRHCVMEGDSHMFQKLKLNPEATYQLDDLLTTLDTLHRRGLLAVILCASNVFTLAAALEVKKWAAGRGAGGVAFLASEVLRAHPRSPGLLVPPLAANAGQSFS